jgi:hypothetical protein
MRPGIPEPTAVHACMPMTPQIDTEWIRRSNLQS